MDSPIEEINTRQKKSAEYRFYAFFLFLVGLFAMYIYAIWDNRKLMQVMNPANWQPGDDQTYYRLLINKMGPTKLALASSFPFLSGLLGYNNAYTAEFAAITAEVENATIDVISHLIYILETSPNISLVQAWDIVFDLHNKTKPKNVPVKRENWVMRYGLPFLNTGLMIFAVF